MRNCTLLYFVLFLLTSCQSENKKNSVVSISSYAPSEEFYLPNSEVRLISTFENELELKDPKPIEVDVLGIRHFLIKGDILLVNTTLQEDILKFLSAENYELLGQGLSVGNGPGEVPIANSVSFSNSSSLFTQNEDLCLSIYHMYRPTVLDVDVTKSIINQKLETVDSDSLPKQLFSAIRFDDHKYFIKTLTKDHTQQLVSMWVNGENVVTGDMKNLNLAHAHDFNLFGSLLVPSNNGKWIAEGMASLNQINFISTDEDNKSFTVCVGDALESIKEVEEQERKDRKVCYQGICAQDDYVCFLYIGLGEKDFQLERDKGQDEIHCLGWDGKPIARLKLDRPIRRFCINKARQTILVMDLEDNLLEYELPDFM